MVASGPFIRKVVEGRGAILKPGVGASPEPGSLVSTKAFGSLVIR
jgi:hypothetical protein